ncbi:hypothetical protein ABIB17_002522 [Arthrobacter sp. UYEF6]
MKLHKTLAELYAELGRWSGIVELTDGPTKTKQPLTY